MISLIPKHRVQVPHKLAVIAAVILAVTAYAGLSQRDATAPDLAANAPLAVEAQAESTINGSDLAPKKRKLNISALLFGHG